MIAILVLTLLILSFPISAYAITESDIQAQVDAQGKDIVTGNFLIWFLCAIAFLKVSQKIDSFLSALGIHVGNTGGSMLAETMSAARGFTGIKNMAGGNFTKATNTSSAMNAVGFMSGGLAGAVGRGMTKSATQGITGSGGNVVTNKMFQNSLSKGGHFANQVIGSVAQGSISQGGIITGESATQSLQSYLGYSQQSTHSDNNHTLGTSNFSNVEIGGGRITGNEITPNNPNGIAFGMYQKEQYMPPEGSHTMVEAVDGSKWYKEYAKDTVEKIPYMKADGQIAYQMNMVEKLPPMPRRKDRI